MTLAEMLRSSGVAAGEIAATLGSGLVAQPAAGIWGLAEGTTKGLMRGKPFGPAAREGIESVQNALTYQPRTDIGQRGLENVVKGIETVTEPIYENLIDPAGVRYPALGAAATAGLELAGPRGKPKASALTKALRTDPLSPQGLLPGVEPLTPQQALTRSLVQQEQATNAASFTDRGVRYQYQPDTSQYSVNSLRGNSPTADGPSMFNSYLADPEVPTFDNRGATGSERTQAGGAIENFTRMDDKQQAVRAATRDVDRHRVNVGTIERDAQQAVIDELRGRRAALGDVDINERVDLERDIFRAKRDQPIVLRDEKVYRQTDNSTTPSPRYQAVGRAGDSSMVLDETDSPVMLQHADRGREQQRILVNALREQEAYGDFMNPEPSMPEPQPRWVQDMTRLPSNDSANFAGPGWWETKLGVRAPTDPTPEHTGAVRAFFNEIADEPDAFMYGTKNDYNNLYSMDDLADRFSLKSNQEIRARGHENTSDYDSYPYIKEIRKHGRGEVMRDSYGDYKEYEKTHEPGDVPMYDEDGNVKKIIDDEGNPTDNKKFALGGEPRRDSYGDQKYGFKKSRGGETMYDEHGRVKKDEVENPDYREPGTSYTLSVPGKGHISYQVDADNQASIGATQGGKGSGAGELLYALANAHATKNDINIGTHGLYPANQLRILSNAMSNFARFGENPRDLGDATPKLSRYGDDSKNLRVKDDNDPWQMMRAEHFELDRRLKEQAIELDDPSIANSLNRVAFDGDTFTIDGKAVTAKELRGRVDELAPLARSPKFDPADGGYTMGETIGSMGEKSLMRSALYRYLATATPDDAKRVAKNWKKIGGPIFAGSGAAALGLSSLLREDNQQDEAATQ